MQWEYQVANWGSTAASRSSLDGMAAELNQFGSEGWELIAEDHGRLIFKRPLPDRNMLPGPRPLKSAAE